MRDRRSRCDPRAACLDVRELPSLPPETGRFGAIRPAVPISSSRASPESLEFTSKGYNLILGAKLRQPQFLPQRPCYGHEFLGTD